MRFLLYNIRYGAGTGWRFHWPIPFSGYLRRSVDTLALITDFLKSSEPDIIGLIEVDNGSYRSNKCNQAETIAEALSHAHVYESKYEQNSFAQNVPVLKEQGNAFITNQDIMAKGFHYFNQGVKRLVIELEFDDFVIFLVHLSLHYRHRQYQLTDLNEIFQAVDKPMIVAGDFNAFWGSRELDLFMAAANLHNANLENTPTFPAIVPDANSILSFTAPSIQIDHFEVPQATFSDHMPIICDFTVPGGTREER